MKENLKKLIGEIMDLEMQLIDLKPVKKTRKIIYYKCRRCGAVNQLFYATKTIYLPNSRSKKAEFTEIYCKNCGSKDFEKIVKVEEYVDHKIQKRQDIKEQIEQKKRELKEVFEQIRKQANFEVKDEYIVFRGSVYYYTEQIEDPEDRELANLLLRAYNILFA